MIPIWFHGYFPMSAENHGRRKYIQAGKGQYQLNCILIQLYRNMCQAKNIIMQLNRTAGTVEWCAGGKTDLPLINFRSRERHQQDLVPLSYQRQRLQGKGGKRRRGMGKKRDENRKTERMWFVLTWSLVSDNTVNLALKKITSKKRKLPCSYVARKKRHYEHWTHRGD